MVVSNGHDVAERGYGLWRFYGAAWQGCGFPGASVKDFYFADGTGTGEVPPWPLTCCPSRGVGGGTHTLFEN